MFNISVWQTIVSLLFKYMGLFYNIINMYGRLLYEIINIYKVVESYNC